MTEHDEQQTTSDLSQSGRSDQRSILASPLRRRLVKGAALALPAIMTLPSGSAQAAASIYTCKMKAGMNGDGQLPSGVALVTATDNLDSYHREPVHVRDIDNTWAPGEKIYYDPFPVSGPVWRKFDDVGTVVPPLPSGSTDPGGAALSDEFAIAFVGADGTIAALAPPLSGQYAAVSDNCFNSTGLMTHNI